MRARDANRDIPPGILPAGRGCGNMPEMNSRCVKIALLAFLTLSLGCLAAITEARAPLPQAIRRQSASRGAARATRRLSVKPARQSSSIRTTASPSILRQRTIKSGKLRIMSGNGSAAGSLRSHSKRSDDPEMAAIPTNDCLGLTAQLAQRTCGASSVRRNIVPILNGYECTYSLFDPNAFEGSGVGTQVKLKYFVDGRTIEELADAARESDPEAHFQSIKNGFALQTPLSLDIYRKSGSVTTFIAGAIIDDPYIDSAPLECSFAEMWDIFSIVTGDNPGGEKTLKLPTLSSPTPANSAKEEQNACPCQIMIVEVKGEADLRRADGEFLTAEKGQLLEPGDAIYTGENSQVTVAFFNCGFGNGNDDVGIAIIKASQMGKIIQKDGKPAVFFDPGVATVSVKQLAQFQTDFQVSTPRLTCSVRG